VRWLTRLAGSGLMLLAGLAGVSGASAQPVVTYDRAALRVTPYQDLAPDPVDSPMLAQLPAPDPQEFAQPAQEAPGTPGAWQPARLPVILPREVLPSAGETPLRVWWYQVSYTVPAGVTRSLALYVPRVSGGAVLVVSHRGGRWRLLSDATEHWREQWNRPIWVDLGVPPAQGEVLTLALGIVHPDGAGHRLTSLRIGPQDALQSPLAWRRLLQVVVPQVSSLSFVSLGLFSFLFWLRRRQESAYLLFALTAVAWWLRNLHYYIDLPRDAQSLSWFWWATNGALSWVMVLVYLFAFRFDPRRYPGLERALVAFVVAMTLLTMPWPGVFAGNLIVQHLVNTGVALVVLGWMTVVAWRGGGREFRVLTTGLWLTEVMGLHDLLLVAGRLNPETVYLLPFAPLVIFLAFLYAVQRRYAQAIQQVEQTNAGLAQRLADREAELRANHERLREAEREQALLRERQRLMRDMHDGLGSTLMSSLVMVEQGRLDSPAVALLLRECMDDLRLVIDSLEPIDHDLLTLLASLRHRLGRRLEAGGLQLTWAVEDLPPLPWLHPPDALQVLRIVQEVLTNILKHAGARQVRIATRVAGPEVQVLISDDGIGFDPATVDRGRGLRHLAQRAAQLGGRIEVASQPGQGTQVCLALPVERAMPA
jgi:signal transduction histidine kinase